MLTVGDHEDQITQAISQDFHIPSNLAEMHIREFLTCLEQQGLIYVDSTITPNPRERTNA